jgi:hypothetical protein
MNFFRKAGVRVFHRRSDLPHVDLEEAAPAGAGEVPAPPRRARICGCTSTISGAIRSILPEHAQKTVRRAVRRRDPGVPESVLPECSRRKTTQNAGRSISSPAWTAERRSSRDSQFQNAGGGRRYAAYLRYTFTTVLRSQAGVPVKAYRGRRGHHGVQRRAEDRIQRDDPGAAVRQSERASARTGSTSHQECVQRGARDLGIHS